MNQKRQPKGIPVGGEFAANDHDEARHWLADKPFAPTPTQPNATSAIRPNGDAAVMMPGSGQKVVYPVGASQFCESSGIYDASTDTIRLRYGVDAEEMPHWSSTREARTFDDVQAQVADMIEGGTPPENIYVALRSNHDFQIVNRHEVKPEGFRNYGGYVVSSDSPDNAFHDIRSYQDWKSDRRFDVLEREVRRDGSMSEPEIVVEYADGKVSGLAAHFRDFD